jgi:hypothetical protein
MAAAAARTFFPASVEAATPVVPRAVLASAVGADIVDAPLLVPAKRRGSEATRRTAGQLITSVS